MEDHIMSAVIDNLISKEEYNIYENRNISDENLEELAVLFQMEGNNLEDYLYLGNYKSKFCWFNILHIIEKMKYSMKIRYIPFLIRLLQDANWPAFEYAVSLLSSYNKSDLIPFIEDALWKAYKSDDGMWISGIDILLEHIPIKPSEFENPKTYGLLKYGDF